jgi:hypothetical protein
MRDLAPDHDGRRHTDPRLRCPRDLDDRIPGFLLEHHDRLAQVYHHRARRLIHQLGADRLTHPHVSGEVIQPLVIGEHDVAPALDKRPPRDDFHGYTPFDSTSLNLRLPGAATTLFVLVRSAYEARAGEIERKDRLHARSYEKHLPGPIDHPVSHRST